MIIAKNELKVVFMSGYTDDIFEDTGSHTPEFLQKPFTAEALVRSIHATLQRVTRVEPKRILIVDDEPAVLKLVPRLLDAEGYRCSVASSVAQARRILDHECPDVILCDMVMPDQDGIDLLRIVRSNHENCAFVAMSGHMTRHAVLAAAKKMGAAFTLVKPFNRSELMNALAEAGRSPAA